MNTVPPQYNYLDISEDFQSFLRWGTLFTEGGRYSLGNNIQGDNIRGDSIHSDTGPVFAPSKWIPSIFRSAKSEPGSVFAQPKVDPVRVDFFGTSQPNSKLA